MDILTRNTFVSAHPDLQAKTAKTVTRWDVPRDNIYESGLFFIYFLSLKLKIRGKVKGPDYTASFQPRLKIFVAITWRISARARNLKLGGKTCQEALSA